ncbi:hypothetical protein FVE85_3681 [Porphyridium purpureum]|uniref:50S ribosomal protein L10 n=1 Tax=Porphyridium purpureum TaxID=35688 RepID=A0A5J4YNG0_PORPP|nr:hypothetical protein FVE85_3681 [Porphyridium purpureum]|eukprot:POR3519..scf249_10
MVEPTRIPWRKLEREVRKYEWSERFKNASVMVFAQLMRGEGWGRKMARLKLLEHPQTEASLQEADVHYMAPALGKRVIRGTAYEQRLSPIFRVAPFAVVHGRDPDKVLALSTRLRAMYPKAMFLAARFDDIIIDQAALVELEKGPKTAGLFAELVQTISARPAIVDLLDQSVGQLRTLLDQSNQSIATRLQQMESEKAPDSQPSE